MWSIHWPSLTAFLDLATQWQVVVGASGRLIWLGIDYVAADVVLRRRGAGEAVFADIRAMEQAAIKVLNEVTP